VPEAETAYREALTRASELCMRPLVAHCHLGLGKLYRRTGDHAKANEHLTTATAMYREMGMSFWLEKAAAEIKGPARTRRGERHVHDEGRAHHGDRTASNRARRGARAADGHGGTPADAEPRACGSAGAAGGYQRSPQSHQPLDVRSSASAPDAPRECNE